jgi:hypothetical protein
VESLLVLPFTMTKSVVSQSSIRDLPEELGQLFESRLALCLTRQKWASHHPDVTVMCELFQGRASTTFLIQVIVHRIAGSVVQGLQIERMQGLENRCKRMGT